MIKQMGENDNDNQAAPFPQLNQGSMNKSNSQNLILTEKAKEVKVNEVLFQKHSKIRNDDMIYNIK